MIIAGDCWMTASRRGFLGMGLGSALAACAPAAVGAARPSRFVWNLRPPEAAGITRAGLDLVRLAIQKNIDARNIPGAVTAIVRRNRLIWFEAQGYRDPNARVAMQKNDIFRMTSSTKVVTSVAILMMMEEGRLSLDDEISRFIPSFAHPRVAIAPPEGEDPSKVSFVLAARDITIRDLLTHTSGLLSFTKEVRPGVGALVSNIGKARSDEALADFVPRLGLAPLDFQPGTRWRYSPLAGMDTLLRIVEIVSGQTADIFLRERLFQPLGMIDTYFNVPSDKRSRVVEVYGRSGGGWEVKEPLMGRGPFRYLSGSAGLFSTVHDFINFELMLLNQGSFNGHRILQPGTVRLMTTNQVGRLYEGGPRISAGEGFGLGVRVVEDERFGDGRGAGAFGWGGAHGTESWADPTLEIAAALFVQTDRGSRETLLDFEQAIRQAVAT